MKGKFKDFYKFVRCLSPNIINLWEDFHNRPDPKKGDKFKIEFNGVIDTFIFDKVIFDENFTNGVAFYYKFKTINDDEFSIYSINDVYDPTKLNIRDIDNIYSFWKHCKPI